MALFARQGQQGRAPGAVRGGIARDRRSVLFGGARRRRVLRWLALVVVAGAIAGTLVAVGPARARTPGPPPTARERVPTARIGPAPSPPADDGRGEDIAYPPIRWRISRAVGLPFDGKLRRGVQLPAAGPDWFTWDPVFNRTGDRGWRRWGTDALLRTLLATLRSYRAQDPLAPRVGVMDLSRHHGGFFGAKFGGLGHASHQNGLDVDVLYPRRDERARRAFKPSQVDRRRAQRLVDLFVAAGAQKIFVGPSLDLKGPKSVVIPLIYHDDHLHLRIPPPPR